MIHEWISRNAITRPERSLTGSLLRHLKGFLEMDEMLSGFQGIDFPEGYTLARAKVLLKALMREIRPPVKRLYPELVGGRPSITLDGPRVWDCFGVKPKFTDDLHLTFSLGEEDTVIAITLPNAATQRWRRLRAVLEDPILSLKLQQALGRLRREVPELWIRVDQRHFIGQRQIVPDAVLEFKVDTADFAARRSRGVRPFPTWFKAAQEAVLRRHGVNLQFMVRAQFASDQVREMRTARFADIALQTLRSFRPLYDLLRGK